MKKWLAEVAILAKDGIRNGLKNRRWYVLGWLATWLFPLAFVSVYLGLETARKPKVSFEPWLLLVLAVLLVIYYKKVRRTVRDKLLTATVRGVPVNPLWHLVNGAAAVGVLAACYWLTGLLDQFSLADLANYLALCMASVGFGSLCYAIDATDNLIRLRALGKENPC